jgi:hypothetical protein
MPTSLQSASTTHPQIAPPPISNSYKTTLGSVLARWVSQPDLLEVIPAFDSMVVAENFETPRYSADFLQRTNSILIRLERFSQRCIHGLNGGCCATCVALRDPKQRVTGNRLGRKLHAVEDAPTRGFIGNVYIGCDGSMGDGWKKRTGPRFCTALDLEEYAASHKDNEAATVTHFTHWCCECRMHVTTLHNADRCSERLLVEQKASSELLAKRRRVREQRFRREMLKQGMWVGVYSPEEYDLAITTSKKGAVEAEAVKHFDRDLLRKGNKYRIR